MCGATARLSLSLAKDNCPFCCFRITTRRRRKPRGCGQCASPMNWRPAMKPI